jgi:hypothetical protein
LQPVDSALVIGPGHGHDLAALVERRPRGDEGARAERGLDDERDPGKPADQPIPLREAAGVGPLSGWELAQQESVGRHALVEHSVGGRIDDAQSVTQHADRGPPTSSAVDWATASSPRAMPLTTTSPTRAASMATPRATAWP